MDTWYSRSLSITSQLSSEESRDIFFLCKDFVPRGAPELSDLINELQKGGHIDETNNDLIEELLYYINRYDLLKKHFNTDKEQMKKKLWSSKKAKINPFRLFLYKLAEHVPDSEFVKIKNVFSDELPRAKLEKATNLLDAFLELEKKGVLQDLEYLKEKSDSFNNDFKMELLQYEQNYTVADEDQGEEMQSYSEDCSKESEMFYSMNSKDRGTCLIINNFNFEKSRQNHPGCMPLENRKGTEKDQESLNEVFSILGFHVEVKNDLEGNEILETVRSYSMKDYENNDCFICCILSHGNIGLVYGTDGKRVAIRDLTSCFSRRKCPSLNGKPKLFFIQACQGHQPQNCVPVESDACNVSHEDNVTVKDLLPEEPDFLLGMATVLHCLAFREPKEGSWYIQSLCSEIRANYHRGEDILSILTKVNEQVSKKCIQNNTQMPQPWFTLIKKLVFNLPPITASSPVTS